MEIHCNRNCHIPRSSLRSSWHSYLTVGEGAAASRSMVTVVVPVAALVAVAIAVAVAGFAFAATAVFLVIATVIATGMT